MLPPNVVLTALLLLSSLGISLRSGAPLAAFEGPSTCGAMSLKTWTSQEAWVWIQACAGKIADFNELDTYGGRLDPKSADDWPQSRVLRSEFIETVMLDKPFREELHRHGLRIVGAWFIDPVDLSNASLAHPLMLAQSRFDSTVNLSRTDTSHFISFVGSRFSDVLLMEELQISSALLNLDLAEFQTVNLPRANIGELRFSSVIVKGLVNMQEITVEHSIFMRYRSKFNLVIMNGAKSGGDVDFSSSSFTGILQMADTQVGDNLQMGDGAEFSEVNLVGTKVGGQINLSQATFSGLLQMSSMQIDDSVLVMGGSTFSDVQLIGAKIGGELGIQESTFNNGIVMDRVNVNTINLLHSVVDGSVSLKFATVLNNLDFSGSTFNSNVDLTGAQISGEFSLGPPPIVWEQGVHMILRNTHVEIIQDLGTSWPDKLELNGFTYNQLGGIGAGREDLLVNRDIDWFEQWLSKQETYSQQPYNQLANAFLNSGQKDKARDIQYLKKERERTERASGIYLIWLTFVKWFTGYGYRLDWSAYWFFGAVVLGTVLQIIAKQGPSPGQWMGSLRYSLDMMLPIVVLRKSHEAVELSGWIDLYFTCHKLFGYALAIFLITTIPEIVT